MRNKFKNKLIKEVLSFLSLPNEKLLFVGKPHAITLFLPLISVGSIVLCLLVITGYFFLVLYSQPTLFLFALIAALLFGGIGLIATLFEWIIHFYIVTDRKIIEMYYASPISHSLSTILLDQVRCTEVDIQKNGLVREVLDVGDVVITFDRPTHHDAFILKDIKLPEKVGIYLGDILTTKGNQALKKPFWYKDIKTPSHLQLGEDIDVTSPLSTTLYPRLD